MAKFEEYAAKQDQLTSEIDEAAKGTENRQSDNSPLPERFKGKTAEEIAHSYEELERLSSRQGNDLGVMRKTMDEFIKLQSGITSQPEPVDAKPASIDDLYADADAVIRRVVKEETGTRIEQLENQLAKARLDTGMNEFDTKYPGWRKEAESQEFRDWVLQSNYRVRMAQAADQRGDIVAAEDLVVMWRDRKDAKVTQDNVQRDKALRNATLEQSGPESPYIGESYSRADVVRATVQAKRGDENAITWLKKHRAGIAQAYNDGTITD